MALLWSGMETTPALAAPGYSLCTHRETTDCVRVTGGRRSKVVSARKAAADILERIVDPKDKAWFLSGREHGATWLSAYGGD